ncbi:flagellar hook-length control protein FliK [Hyphococcus lacteus]|uniref:Flagellar hook-length control protein FliK n=1 Tax=Hyphococcus lacteus TaxID=3143536 RepID=A0ABV3Z8A0_9PROT
MENSHISFLTSLGGKSVGEAFANGGIATKKGEGETENAGFFTFLESLLSQAKKPSGTNENALVTVSAMSSENLPQGNFEFTPAIKRDGTINQETTEISTATSISGPVSGKPDLTISSGDADSSKAGLVTQNNGLPLKSANLESTNAAIDGESPEVSREIEIVDEAEGELRFPIGKSQQQKAVLNGAAVVSNFALSNADASAVEVVGNQVSSDADIEIGERTTHSKLETVSVTTDKSAHVNPMRDQIVAAVSNRQGDSRLEVRLDPPELGKLMIGFEGDSPDNIVRAVISADSPETLDLLRRNADVFQRALAEQGMGTLDLEFRQGGQQNSSGEEAPQSLLSLNAGEKNGAADQDVSPMLTALGRLDRRL